MLTTFVLVIATAVMPLLLLVRLAAQLFPNDGASKHPWFFVRRVLIVWALLGTCYVVGAILSVDAMQAQPAGQAPDWLVHAVSDLPLAGLLVFALVRWARSGGRFGLRPGRRGAGKEVELSGKHPLTRR